MTPAEVVAGIGQVLRSAGRRGGVASEFDRDQLLSAYSASRPLAVELATYEAEMRVFVDELAGIAPSTVEQLSGVLDPRRVGVVVCDLLAELRARDDDEARRQREAVHGLLRRLADREVDLLADGLG
jgi:hypothetical protein